MKFLLSFAIVTISIILLALPLINGAPTPTQSSSQSPQSPEQINKTLKEGLNVMLKIMVSNVACVASCKIQLSISMAT